MQTAPSTNQLASPMPDPWITTEQAAVLISVAPGTLRDWKCQRIGPPFIQVTPRCVRYDVRDIQRWMSERRTVPCVRETRSTHASLQKRA